jgi:hypothetical protein
MSWLARRDRAQITGWIAGYGIDSGHRVLIGHWHILRYGAVADVMVESLVGHRTLYARNHTAGGDFLTATYRLD